MTLLQDTGSQFSIKYGTGAVRGKVVTDVLRFSQPPIVIPDQGFGLATEHSADFASASCDGIFVSHAPLLHSHLCRNSIICLMQHQRNDISDCIDLP